MSRTHTSAPRAARSRASAATWTDSPPCGGGQSPTSATRSASMLGGRRLLRLALVRRGAFGRVGPLAVDRPREAERVEHALERARGERRAVAERPEGRVLPEHLPPEREPVRAAEV